MNGRTRVCAVSVAAFLALALAAPGSATAKPAKISGKLSKPNYTVIALGQIGEASTDRAPNGRFSLRPPTTRVTLHLRASDGTYAGPVVIAKTDDGKEAILGLRSGAKLGQVKIESDKGYAKVAQPLADKYVDAKRTARARKGVPIGAGNVGLVKSKKFDGGTPGDLDLDGVSDSLDIDDDGDLILDEYDRSTKMGASRATPSSMIGSSSGPFMRPQTMMFPAGGGAVNVSGGSSDQQIAAAGRSYGAMSVLWGGVDPGSAELDCGALIYCAAGGTGTYIPTATTPFADALAFPECCDSDGDGLGSLTDTLPSAAAADLHGMILIAGAALRAGDVLIERARLDGAPVELASSMGFVFSTFPVLAAYDDGQGNSATFSYPHAVGAIPVRAGPSGDVVVRLTFWRPQRRRIEGDPGQGEWMDVGNLIYTATVPAASTAGECPLSSYSDIDSNLILKPSSGTLPSAFTGYHLEDLQTDRPSNPANTFTYKLNLTDCLASNGLTMSTTEPAGFHFSAIDQDPEGGGTASSTAQFLPQP